MPPSSTGGINPPLQADGGRISRAPEPPKGPRDVLHDLVFLALGLVIVYLLMLSVVGGAILPRYLLPIFPLVYLVAVVFIFRLPRALARIICVASAACFMSASFINPPYPFPFEDNLSYADFIHVHQQAAQYLEGQPGTPRILTAWPASDELTRPFLGYVRKSLYVVPIQGFTSENFRDVNRGSFDVLYLYSRKWEPENNWVTRFPQLQKLQAKYFDYAPQVPGEILAARYQLRLLVAVARRGQWARVYAK